MRDHICDRMYKLLKELQGDLETYRKAFKNPVAKRAVSTRICEVAVLLEEVERAYRGDNAPDAEYREKP